MPLGSGIFSVDWPANQAAHEQIVTATGEPSRHHRDPDALSGDVNGSSLESATKIASKLAGSVALAFSLML